MPRGNKRPGHAAKRYSLWLMPGGAAYRKLANLIGALGLKHRTPAFAPHVTLLGRITTPRREAILLSAELAKHQRPLLIRLTTVDYRDERFRCLFVKATKTNELMKAHRLARRTFGVQGLAAYLPHLSLVYGDLPSHLKKEIIRSLGRRCELEFKVRSLQLYLTTGEPKNWSRVKNFKLK